MVSVTFSLTSVHQTASASCCTWFVVTVCAHLVTQRTWQGYGQLSHKHKLAWCNRIASAAHATVLVIGQIPNLTDPVLNADPLHGVTDGQFFWGSIMYGYLLYDTAFTLLFYNAVGSVCFLLHHALGFICCCFGLYFNKMMLFGAAIMVFFEGTTPLLHLLGCLKLMGRDSTTIFMGLGRCFVVHFFLSRVVVGSYYWCRMILSTMSLQHTPVWALGGIVVYGVLTALNCFWLYKLLQLALALSPAEAVTKDPSHSLCFPAAAVELTAASGEAAVTVMSISSIESKPKAE